MEKAEAIKYEEEVHMADKVPGLYESTSTQLAIIKLVNELTNFHSSTCQNPNTDPDKIALEEVKIIKKYKETIPEKLAFEVIQNIRKDFSVEMYRYYALLYRAHIYSEEYRYADKPIPDEQILIHANATQEVVTSIIENNSDDLRRSIANFLKITADAHEKHHEHFISFLLSKLGYGPDNKKSAESIIKLLIEPDNTIKKVIKHITEKGIDESTDDILELIECICDTPDIFHDFIIEILNAELLKEINSTGISFAITSLIREKMHNPTTTQTAKNTSPEEEVSNALRYTQLATKIIDEYFNEAKSDETNPEIMDLKIRTLISLHYFYNPGKKGILLSNFPPKVRQDVISQLNQVLIKNEYPDEKRHLIMSTFSNELNT